MKKEEIKVVLKTDSNGCWSGSAYFVNPVKQRRYQMSVAAGAAMKMRTAKSYVVSELNAHAAEYLAENPDCVRVNHDVYEDFAEVCCD